MRSARRLPTVIPDHLVAIRNAGGSTWRWHHGNDPDSALVRAALIIAMHRTAVDVHGGVVDLLPGFIEPWLGRPIDVSGLSTPMGSVSYALRWHGERPALLWEIEPTSADASVEIRASALDPSFSSTDRSGEVLLEVPPMAAGRLDEIRRSEP